MQSARVALEAVKARKSAAELASGPAVPVSKINTRKRPALQAPPGVFALGEAREEPQREAEGDRFHQHIGKLRVKMDRLKEGPDFSPDGRADVPAHQARSWEPDNRRQCGLTGLPRASSYRYAAAGAEAAENLAYITRIHLCLISLAAPRVALELPRGDVLCRLGHQVDRQKPQRQRRLARREHRPRPHRGLVAADAALIRALAPAHQRGALRMPAAPSAKLLGPTRLLQERHTLGLSAKLGERLRQWHPALKLEPVRGHGCAPPQRPGTGPALARGLDPQA